MTTSNFRWYKLDSAAIIFPAIISAKLTTMYRLSCDLTEEVDNSLLQTALEKIILRFPYFKVYLRRGLFWYYFDTNPRTPRIGEDTNEPCARLPIKNKHVFPFRVVYYVNRIAVEFSHAITDGHGALIFLKSLVVKYLELRGYALRKAPGVFYDSEEPDVAEAEDGYLKYFKERVPLPVLFKRAFQAPYANSRHHFYYITTAILPARELFERAAAYKVTVTVYLTAILFEIYQDLMIDHNRHRVVKNYKDIRIMVPVNLRRLYPSKTMKNFVLYISPVIDPRLGLYSFDEIVKRVDLFFKMEINEKNIIQQLSRNIRGAKYVRFFPLFMKKIIFNIFYEIFGDIIYTTSISNLGLVNLPGDLAKHITRFEFYPPLNPKTKINCSVIGYQDKIYLSFGRTARESEIEKRFFRKLVKRGIPVKIETNNYL